MKNQYVGDIGDYGKYSLLRFLAESNVRIGVNWYLTKNDGSTDGKFTEYLKNSDEAVYDNVIFHKLKKIAGRSDKAVQDVEKENLIPGALYYNELIPEDSADTRGRDINRRLWFNNSLLLLKDAALVFADPDNGISFRKKAGNKGSEKYVLPEEVTKYYNQGQNVVFYCHKGRRTADAWEQTKTGIKEYLPDAQLIVLTYHRGTQRSYIFVLHPDDYARFDDILTGFIASNWGCFFTREPVSESKMNTMRVATMSFRLHAPWVHSLKEKRMIVKSLIAKLQNRFHVSAAEIDEQDTHQIIVIGMAAIVPHNAMADSLMDELSSFVEENTEAEILDEEREIR